MRCAPVSGEPVEKSSSAITSCDRPSRRSQRGEPRNPAPPVTRIRFMVITSRPASTSSPSCRRARLCRPLLEELSRITLERLGAVSRGVELERAGARAPPELEPLPFGHLADHAEDLLRVMGDQDRSPGLEELVEPRPCVAH